MVKLLPIEAFVLNNPSNYIRFTPKKFQQAAPLYKYRADEKTNIQVYFKKFSFCI